LNRFRIALLRFQVKLWQPPVFPRAPFVGENPKVELLSITENDPNRIINKDVKGAHFGTNDTSFHINTENWSAQNFVYTVTA